MQDCTGFSILFGIGHFNDDFSDTCRVTYRFFMAVAQTGSGQILYGDLHPNFLRSAEGDSGTYAPLRSVCHDKSLRLLELVFSNEKGVGRYVFIVFNGDLHFRMGSEEDLCTGLVKHTVCGKSP